ncbi:uncharacterized protein [Eucyclogobius newberryi]|uniref:uncharacterized protein n=1 Tax=Eucyclogobius newberryi TaxID=166745 RepID=UPI003B5C9046
MSACNSRPLHMLPGKVRGFDTVGTILTHDQGQMLGPELNLTEMSEGEFTHLQHIIQTHMEVSDMAADQNTSLSKDTVTSPLATTQAIDLSTSSDGHEVILPEEKTPLCYGEVPGFVLAKMREDDTAPSNACSLPSQTRGPSTARVCLEKRFNSISGSLGPQDNLIAVINNFLEGVQQPSEAQDVSAHPHLQSWNRHNRIYDMSDSLIGIYNPVTNLCEQVLVIPKGPPLNICPERVPANNHSASTNSTSGNKKTLHPAAKCVPLRAKPRASKDTSDSLGETASKKQAHGVPLSLHKERHNSRERERRRRIRLSCDELNKLVPFCQKDTDKVSTLQWTAAYLRYITKMYGDTLKEVCLQRITSQDSSATNHQILRDIENMPVKP